MHIRTVSVLLSASRDVVFNFMANVENLPKWATEFCDRIELRRNGWLAYTSQGEMMVESDADDRTGVIDLRIGPSAETLGLLPVRVLHLAPARTLLSFTFIQQPGLPDENYEKQYQSLLVEMRGLIGRFGGGELHAPADALQFGAMGLN